MAGKMMLSAEGRARPRAVLRAVRVSTLSERIVAIERGLRIDEGEEG